VARGPKPPAVVLSTEEREGLERVVRAHGTAQQVALRARLVLAAAAGRSNAEIARKEGVSVDAVRLWRGRWLALRAGRRRTWARGRGWRTRRAGGVRPADQPVDGPRARCGGRQARHRGPPLAAARGPSFKGRATSGRIACATG
jgi:hypothetical protein